MRFCFRIIVLLVAGQSIFGCYADERDRILRDGLVKLTFPCNDSTSKYYFRGKFDDDSVCLYHNQFDCYTMFGQALSFRTTTPYAVFGDTIIGEATTWLQFGIDQYIPRDDEVPGGYVGQDHYLIRTPEMKYGPSTDSLIMAYLQPGPSIFWQHEHDELGIPQGLEVYIFKNHYNSEIKKEHIQLHLTSARGDQTGSSIEITELVLNDYGTHVEGHIHLRIKCKMYLDIQGRYDGHYDGDFAGDFSGEVNMPVSYDR